MGVEVYDSPASSSLDHIVEIPMVHLVPGRTLKQRTIDIMEHTDQSLLCLGTLELDKIKIATK